MSPTLTLPTLHLTTSARPHRALGALLIVDALLSFAPVAILGAAIGWPASLDKPAAEQLAAIAAAPGGVALGYGVYLLYSVLVAPVLIAARAPSRAGSPCRPVPFGALVVSGRPSAPALADGSGAASTHAAGDSARDAGRALFDAVHPTGRIVEILA